MYSHPYDCRGPGIFVIWFSHFLSSLNMFTYNKDAAFSLFLFFSFTLIEWRPLDSSSYKLSEIQKGMLRILIFDSQLNLFFYTVCGLPFFV